MIIGCSECLCIAIESRRYELLRDMLELPEIEYRDIYWSTLPVLSSIANSTNTKVVDMSTAIFELHHIDKDTDLSFVGKPDCGHMQIDVELCTPLQMDPTHVFPNSFSAHILVSLIEVAKQHSSEKFPAMQMLQKSGKFDLGSLQMFHFNEKLKEYNIRDNDICSGVNEEPSPLLPGPLQASNQWRLRYQFATPFLQNHTGNEIGSIDNLSSMNLQANHFYGEWKQNRIEFHKYNSQFTCLIMEAIYQNALPEIHNILFNELINSGFNVNLPLMSVEALIENPHTLWRKSEKIHLLDYLLLIPKYWYTGDSRIRKNDQHFLGKMIVQLLRLGISYFFGDNDLFLFNLFYCCSEQYIPFVRGISRQFLALGFGRSELHPNCERLMDERLDATRRKIDSETSATTKAIRELRDLVERFDAGPLTLLQLSRISVRRCVGGSHFALRVQLLESRLPTPILQYVADPTEQMNFYFD